MKNDVSSASSISESVSIVDRRTATIVQATLKPDFSRGELAEVQARWSSYKRQSLMVQSGETPQTAEHDAWDWPAKHDLTSLKNHRFYAVIYDEEVEGLMMLALKPVASRRAGLFNEEAVYVEYLESAPWNLAHYAGENVQYRRIGASLLFAAVQESRRLGCEGRIALHSLSGAEGFYRQMEFFETGFDEVVGLNYFELPTQPSAPGIEKESQP